MWLLYGFSDALALFLFAIIRYRRRVVLSNLQIAFPEKTAAERLQIARTFYRNFTDNFIETIKLLSASPAFLDKRFVIDNPEILDQFYDQGRKVQLHLGHLFNWEIAGVAMPCAPVYLPGRLHARRKQSFRTAVPPASGRYGTVLLPATRMQRGILPYRNQLYMLTLVADQAPGGPENTYC